jgi:HlyD family secretion protein
MKEQNPESKIHLRSDEVEDIIGAIPHWFVKIGISVIFLFTAIILILCWFFKYPDTVYAKVNLVSNTPPLSIVAKSTGKIEKIFIKDNQQVDKNQVLAVIENTANYADVIKTKDILLSLRLDNKAPFLSNYDIFSGSVKLGNIQSTYSQFLRHFNEYFSFLKLNYHQKKIETINSELDQQNNFKNILNNKLRIYQQQLLISQKQIQRDSQLLKNDIISIADFEKSQAVYLQAQFNYASYHADVVAVNIQIVKLKQQILDLDSEKTEENSLQFTILKEDYENLLAQIVEWENLYLIRTPVTGKVTFTKYWNSNQNVNVGEVIFSVVNLKSDGYIAKIQLPIQSSGKVKVGQKVIIKLDDFPYLEFGLLNERISKISLIPNNNFYYAEVVFPQRLITTYHINVSSKSELNGTAEIITQDQRLLSRLIYPIKSLINKNNLE